MKQSIIELTCVGVVLTLLMVVALLVCIPTAPASEHIGRYNIMVEYLDDKGAYDVFTNVGYSLEPNLLIIRQGSDGVRLVPLYGIEHIRIIHRE